MQKNPNILDKEEAASLNQWRKSLEEILVLFRDDEDTIDSDASKLAGGRGAFNEAIENDRKSKAEADAAEAEEQAQQEEQAVEDDFWAEDATDVSDETPTEETGGVDNGN